MPGAPVEPISEAARMAARAVARWENEGGRTAATKELNT